MEVGCLLGVLEPVSTKIQNNENTHKQRRRQRQQRRGGMLEVADAIMRWR